MKLTIEKDGEEDGRYRRQAYLGRRYLSQSIASGGTSTEEGLTSENHKIHSLTLTTPQKRIGTDSEMVCLCRLYVYLHTHAIRATKRYKEVKSRR
jgi:hypothetical protein